MPLLYGVTVADDVKGLVPDWVPRAGVKPDEVDVTRWLEEFSGRVARRLGNLAGLDADQAAQVEEAARGIVALGAASRLVAARTPAKAGKNDTSYDALLWRWYEESLAELVLAVDELRATDVDVVAAQAGGSAVGSFPAPLFANPSLNGPRVPGAAGSLGYVRLTDPHRY